MKEVYKALRSHYNKLAKGTNSEDRVAKMMDAVVDYCHYWPDDKTGRWVGFVQCLLIEVEKVTTIEAERNFTRPLFHEMYLERGWEVPRSIDIDEEE